MEIKVATLKPMLIPAYFFCEDPLVVIATTAKMNPGMMQGRRKKVPAQSVNVMSESTRENTAKQMLPVSG